MPELAEVEFFRRQWDPGLSCRIRGVDVHADKRVFRGCNIQQLVETLIGSRFVASFSHGKQLMFQFTKDGWLAIHLGMTGELRWDGPDTILGVHDHLVLRQGEGALTFSDPRQFGRVRFHRSRKCPRWWAALPPAILSDDFTADWVEQHLLRHARAPLKAILLRQDIFPGVGNWMADEILWRMGIHPATKSGQVVDKAGMLRKVTRQVCSGALLHVSPKFGNPPSSWLFSHRWKAGGRCPKDGEFLEREEIGGRTTAWCPRCQDKSTRRKMALSRVTSVGQSGLDV